MALIFFSDIPWESLHQRPQHLAGRLAEATAVLWIEPATLGRRSSFSPVTLGRNLHGLSLPFIPYNARNRAIRLISRILSRIASLRTFLALVQGRLLRRTLRTLGMDQDQLICVFENFQALSLISHLRPAMVLYDCIDNPFGFVDFPPHVHREWHAMLQRADLLVATSPNLRAVMQSEVAKPVHIVSNGVEYERFAATPAERPADLPPQGMPIIGYVGSVYTWLDFDLLRFLCVHAPDLRVVIIGHDHPNCARAKLSACSCCCLAAVGSVSRSVLRLMPES